MLKTDSLDEGRMEEKAKNLIEGFKSDAWRENASHRMFALCSFEFFSRGVVDVDSTRTLIQDLASGAVETLDNETVNATLYLATANASVLQLAFMDLVDDVKSHAGNDGAKLRQSSLKRLVVLNGEYESLKALLTELFRAYIVQGSDRRLEARASAALLVSQDLISKLYEVLSGLELSEPLELAQGGIRLWGPALRSVTALNRELCNHGAAVIEAMERIASEMELS